MTRFLKYKVVTSELVVQDMLRWENAEILERRLIRKAPAAVEERGSEKELNMLRRYEYTLKVADFAFKLDRWRSFGIEPHILTHRRNAGEFDGS